MILIPNVVKFEMLLTQFGRARSARLFSKALAAPLGFLESPLRSPHCNNTIGIYLTYIFVLVLDLL